MAILKRTSRSNGTIRVGIKGFTLIELLIVIAIIGILAVVLLVQLGGSRGKARDAKRISDIGQIQTAVELYYNDCGKYPISIDGGSGTQGSCDNTLKGYLNATMTDPQGTAYNYAYSGTSKYQIWATLENDNTALKSDSDINGKSWSGNGSTGTDSPCPSTGVDTCIYDVGQQ